MFALSIDRLFALFAFGEILVDFFAVAEIVVDEGENFFEVECVVLLNDLLRRRPVMLEGIENRIDRNPRPHNPPDSYVIYGDHVVEIVGRYCHDETRLSRRGSAALFAERLCLSDEPASDPRLCRPFPASSGGMGRERL